MNCHNYLKRLLGIPALLLFTVSHLPAQTPKLPTQWTHRAASTTLPFPEYPRPQFQRKEWLNLNGKWDYMGGKNTPSALAPAKPANFAGHQTILVPYCPESFLSGIGKDQEINMWYRRDFVIPATWNKKRVIINFDAVDHQATVFINGNKAGTHAGGYDAFHLEITKYLKPGTNNIVVAAHDPNDGKAPSGKNGPRGDYTFSSGIWQSVWLEPIGSSFIESMSIVPDVDGQKLMISVKADQGTVTATALDGKKVVSKTAGAVKTKLYLPVKQPKLWSPDDPFLYDLKIELRDKNGKITDEVNSYFGMRDVRLGKVNGVVRPLLNGKFEMQIGLLDQGYWPDGILTPPNDEALKSDLEFTKNAGFNLIRKHMKTESKRFYYWADKMGLMVWQDMPAIWYQNEDTLKHRSEFRRELKAVMDDLHNSPSIIAWVPFNENWGAFDIAAITAWVKQYDPTRLVNGNSGFNNNPGYQKALGDPANGDFVDTHIYIGPIGASKPDARRAASLGEFGGVGLFTRGHMWPVENNAYGYEPTSAALTDRYVFLMQQVEQLMLYKGLSVAVYTQTTDVEHEINGLLTYDRKLEKIDIKKIREINQAIIESGRSLNKPKSN